MYCDACDRPTPAQSLPAGAVALKGARSTNREIFRRGWKSAGPPGPGLPPDMDDSQGLTTTSGALHVGLWTDLSLRRDQNENDSANALYGYAHEKATFDIPICGQRTEMDDGHAPERMHGVAYGARPRRRIDDMTTDYDYDAYAATCDARTRAVDDVEGGYVPGRDSDGYACNLDATTRNATPRTASDGAATQTQQAGRMSDTGFDEGYAPGCVSDYAPGSYEYASAAASVDCVQGGHAAALLRFDRRVMDEGQTETSAGYVHGRPRPGDYASGRVSEADCRRAAESYRQAVQNYQREMMCVTDADFVEDRRARPADVVDGYAPGRRPVTTDRKVSFGTDVTPDYE